MTNLNYFRISVIIVLYVVILVSLAGVMPIFASPYALQNQVMVNSTTATSGNITSPMSSTSSDAITITTNKISYNYGDKITISGNTQYYITDTPITLKIINPIGQLVRFDQVNPDYDKTYSWSTTAIGSLWQSAGTYKVVAQYGSTDTISQTTFQFTGQILSNQSSPPNQPLPPTNLIAMSRTLTEVDLSWLAPQNNGGLPITGYKIERNDGNGFNIIAYSQATIYQDKDLAPNSEHAYRVSAINSAGLSIPSNSAPVITLPSTTVPSVPSSNPSTDQNPSQSLSSILQQRYETAKKLQETLNAQATNSSSNSQQSPPIHANPYVRCTNCTDTSNNQSLPQSTQNTSITTPAKIPNWVKAVFGYYAQGKLSDADLISALQFLIQQGIIKL